MTFNLPFEYDGSVTRHFGPVWNGVEFGDDHLGIDWRRDEGEPVKCPADGTVSLITDNDDEAGFSIWVQHTPAVISVFAHLMERPLIEVGDFVVQDEIIGYVGSTGNSTDPHLHFETIVLGEHYNPLTVAANWGYYRSVDWDSTEKETDASNYPQ